MFTHRTRAWLTLAVLFGINFMNFYDRQILPAVQEQMRRSWSMSDSDLGWLGTAFILLYAVVGVPLGRLADVGRRKRVLAAGLGLWSVLTAASGFAWSFWSLFVFRVGVGVGEASCAPTASSMIGDLFPPERRARAMSLFMLGLPLGLGLSFVVSGAIAKSFNWHAAFFLACIPGLILALAILFLEEPVRGAADAHQIDPVSGSEATFLTAVREVLARPTMWWIIASGALHNFNSYALGTFLSSVIQRYHHLDVRGAGLVSGLVYGIGAMGMFAAGWLGDRAFRRRVSGRLDVAWIALALSVPCLLLALAVPAGGAWRFAAWLLPAYLLMYAYYGTVYASIQDIIEPSLRGTAMAVYFFAMYSLGAVLGPVGAGWISDHFASRAARQADVALPLFLAAQPCFSALPGLARTAGMVSALQAQKLALELYSRAIGLHDAMYAVPLISVPLALVLFAASRTVTRDRERLLARTKPR